VVVTVLVTVKMLIVVVGQGRRALAPTRATRSEYT
jgi:hypothetical protein